MRTVVGIMCLSRASVTALEQWGMPVWCGPVVHMCVGDGRGRRRTVLLSACGWQGALCTCGEPTDRGLQDLMG